MESSELWSGKIKLLLKRIPKKRIIFIRMARNISDIKTDR